MIGRLATLVVGVLGTLAAPVAVDWPGGASMRPADVRGALGGNLSGLTLDGEAGLWAVRDSGALIHLDRTDAGWTSSVGSGAERFLRYPDGGGSPDAEAVTTVVGDEKAVYVAAERNTNASNRSRNSILRFEPSGSGPLTATREWRLDAIVGSTAANTGIESLAWVPDSVFVSMGFRDINGKTYVPADFPGHGGGLFVTAVESRGELLFVSLGSDGQAVLVGKSATGLAGIMDVTWSASRQELWAICDDHCDGRAAVLRAGAGAWAIGAILRPPSGMQSLNNEGFALGDSCRDGAMMAVWADDNATGGIALRQSSLSCTPAGATTSPTNTSVSPSVSLAPSPPPSTSPTPSPSSANSPSPAPASSPSSAKPEQPNRRGGYVLFVAAVLGLATALLVTVRIRRRGSSVS